MEAVRNGFEKVNYRLDTLESSLRATLRESRSDIIANTKELGVLSALVQNACCLGIRDRTHLNTENEGSEDASSGGAPQQKDRKVSVEPQDLLRRLKRGYLLQYERDDEDDAENGHKTATSDNNQLFERFKRKVCSPPKIIHGFCKHLSSCRHEMGR